MKWVGAAKQASFKQGMQFLSFLFLSGTGCPFRQEAVKIVLRLA